MSTKSRSKPTTQPTVHRWTRKQFRRLGELNWFPEQRVELLGGEIIEMPIPGIDHDKSTQLTAEIMRVLFGPGHWVRVQMGLVISRITEAMPDIAVVAGELEDYSDTPTAALLVVEVSDSTLWYDRNRKGPRYARGGIADYWIINLPDRCLEVYRNPQRDSANPRRFVYADVVTLRAGDFVTPLAAPQARIAVADLLPK